jgi:hypothetical protein
MGELRYNSTVLNLYTRWRRAVSFTVLRLHPPKKFFWRQLVRRLGEPQSI